MLEQLPLPLWRAEREIMRIETNQKIAGYPARKVGQLMRETLGRPFTDRWVSETLDLISNAYCRGGTSLLDSSLLPEDAAVHGN